MVINEDIQSYIKHWIEEVIQLALDALDKDEYAKGVWEFYKFMKFGELEEEVGMHMLSDAEKERKYTIKVMFVKMIATILICIGTLYFRFRV